MPIWGWIVVVFVMAFIGLLLFSLLKVASDADDIADCQNKRIATRSSNSLERTIRRKKSS